MELHGGQQIFIGTRPGVVLSLTAHGDSETLTVFRPANLTPIGRPGDWSKMCITLLRPSPSHEWFWNWNQPVAIGENTDMSKQVDLEAWLKVLGSLCHDPFRLKV